MLMQCKLLQLLSLVTFAGALTLPVLHSVNATSAVSSNDASATKVLVVDHVPKCGGTFVINLANAAVNSVNPDYLQVVEEDQQMTYADMGSNKYVVGVIRNPFDYYISIWGYLAYRDSMSTEEYEAMIPLGLPAGSHPEDPQRLAKFIHFFSERDLGLLSFLFYYSYLDGAATIANSGWTYKGTVGDAFVHDTHGTLKQQMQSALHSFTLASCPVDCWVHTEAATDDAYACFHNFANFGGIVDWAAFDAEVAAEHKNSGNHVACSEVYTPELLEFVRNSDAGLFRAFGYSPHCSA